MVQAKQTALSAIMTGTEQLRVPLFQRHYRWGEKGDKEWQDLWNDIARLALDRRADPKARHFLGSVVLSKPHPASKGQLIVDGQQRLVTMSLLLCALRDCDVRLPAAVYKRIDRALWLSTTSRSQVYKRIRVLPTEYDQEAFARVLSGEELSAGHLASKAYLYFSKRIGELVSDEAEDDEDYSGVTATEIAQTALAGLECVLVRAVQGDNAHRIFESLNNTGLPLTQADLIRNYVFLRLDGNQEDFYEFTFKPLENRFSPDEFTQLFWLDLILKGEDVTQRQTYSRWQRRMEAMTRAQIQSEFDHLRDRADLWERILHPERETSSTIRLRLHRIKDWGTTTAAPTLLYLLEQRQLNLASYAEVARAIHYLESYFVRRVVIGRATMNMNRVLMVAPAVIEKDSRPVDVVLREHLSGSGKHWASDEELRVNAASKPFYRHGKGHQKTLILRWLEEALHQHDPEFELAKSLSVEHVMPQTLNDAWRSDLAAGLSPGEKVSRVHAELMDTLGNLTLATYKLNSAMSNKSFQEKKDALRKKGGGQLLLTQQVTSRHVWKPQAIRARSRDLVNLIISNWPGPVDVDED